MLNIICGMKDVLGGAISNNIKREIERSSKTKTEIVRAIGVSSPTVSQYLSGKIQPSLVTFFKLCMVLGISAGSILNLSGDKEKF